jgi:fermentation-respiration switch protein FrsA (DUF1100 family)
MRKAFPGALVIFVLICGRCLNLDSFMFNHRAQVNYELTGNTIPDSLITQVTFKSGEYTLYGYWVRGDSVADTGLTIFYCLGNQWSIDFYWDRVMYFHQTGANVFIFDFRGYGLSQGTPTGPGLEEDVRAAWQFVKDAYHVPDESLAVYGYSLGATPAIFIAARDDTAPLCLFVESTFASATSLAQGGAGIDLPQYWLADYDFNNIGTIKKVTCPVFHLHGLADDFCRYRDNGKPFYEVITTPKGHYYPPEGGHGNVPESTGLDRYVAYIKDWIKRSKAGL